jgi:hypothetical protein
MRYEREEAYSSDAAIVKRCTIVRGKGPRNQESTYSSTFTVHTRYSRIIETTYSSTSTFNILNMFDFSEKKQIS